MTMTNKFDLQVVGDRKIHCVSCETLIKLLLQRIAGVEQVTPSASTQRVAVSYDDSQASIGEVQAKLAEMGFAVEQVRV
jgi:copper chaperone CopZ